jgi:glycosyltransferase involved in cell wall biosynthesis
MLNRTSVLFDGIIYKLQSRGGISRSFTELFRHLDGDRGIEPILMVPDNPIGEIPTLQNLTYLRRSPVLPRRVGARLEALRVQLLHPKIFHSTYYTLPERKGYKSVVTIHDFIHERYADQLADPELVARKRQCLESADAIIAVSEDVRNDLLNRFSIPQDRVTVAYHGVSDVFLKGGPDAAEACAFRERFGLARPYWLFVGQRYSYKNFALLLKAFAQIAGTIELDLVAVGGTPAFDRDELDVIRRHRLEGRVHLLPLSDEELCLAYHGSAAFVFPSLAEGFGIPLLEAMACKTPILASDIPVFHEVTGGAAEYFDGYNAESLAAAMQRVLASDVRTELLKQAQMRIGNFSWQKFADIHAGVYRRLA